MDNETFAKIVDPQRTQQELIASLSAENCALHDMCNRAREIMQWIFNNPGHVRLTQAVQDAIDILSIQVSGEGTDVKLAPGTQIIYVPTHAAGDVAHPDAEPGFVTAVRGDVAFCRYWSKSTPGELRTRANSEGTPIDMLVVQDTRPQTAVDEAIKAIKAIGAAQRMLVAVYPKSLPDGDGQTAEVWRTSLGAEFYEIRALPDKNGVGEPLAGFIVDFGGGQGSEAAKIAEMIADGMIGFSPM